MTKRSWNFGSNFNVVHNVVMNYSRFPCKTSCMA